MLPHEYDSVPLPCVSDIGSRQISKESSISKPSNACSDDIDKHRARSSASRSIPIRGKNSVMMPPRLHSQRQTRSKTPTAASYAHPPPHSRHQTPQSHQRFHTPIQHNVSPLPGGSTYMSSAHASPTQATHSIASPFPMMVNSTNYFVPSGYQAKSPRRYTPYVPFNFHFQFSIIY